MVSDATHNIQSVCVFCGASNKALPKYGEMAVALGKELAKNEIRLVYGGASVGLMGKLADEVMAGGGEVYGFIPEDMGKRSHAAQKGEVEVIHAGITKLELVKNMHERKSKMYKNAQAFCALPGGIGTMEELLEVFNWNILGYHGKTKPIVLLDDGKFWDHTMELLNYLIEEKFVRPEYMEFLCRTTSPSEALDFISANL